MKKKIAVISLTAVLAAGPAFASGYRIPEQSINSVALSAAYVANTPSADASYFNPANMSWLDAGCQSEFSLTYINLGSIDYVDSSSASRNGGSRTEDFVLPEFHIVSPNYDKFRFGFSVVYPFGLSKRWDAAFPRTSADEFTLKTYEFNPTMSYQINDKLSIGLGVRAIYTEGKVKSYAGSGAPLWGASRDLEGDALDYGYNLAVSFRPTSNLSLAATYRSKINLEIDGHATLSDDTGIVYNNRYAEVMVPAPAVLSLAASYTCNAGKTTAEFVYDKTYWNAYDKLDFNYDQSLSTLTTPYAAVLASLFDNPGAKNWTNTDAYRIGITHQCTKNLTAMLGFAIDKNPIPDHTLGFELPDSDAKIYSIGIRYRLNDSLQVGAAYLYDDKESRTVSNSYPKPAGTFDNAEAHLLTAGLQYSF